MNEFRYRVSTKRDGNMGEMWSADAVTNREVFLKGNNIEPQNVVLMATEHTDAVVRVGKAEQGTWQTAEALITNEPGVALALLTADCFPVSFFDPVRGAVALAHCGWRPVSLRLAQKVVRRLTDEFESQASDIQVRIGPGIHPESYIQDVTTQADDEAWAPYLTKLQDGRISIDLLRYLTDQLEEAGILKGNITVDPIDTAATLTQFSHYRAIRTDEAEGRFMTVVMVS